MRKIGPWKQLNSKVKYRNNWITVREDSVIRPDGTKGIYGVVDSRYDPVFIVALDNRNRILLVRTYRYPTERYVWEIPAGGSDGEPLLKAARRELQEETSYRAKTWRKAAKLASLNGFASEFMHVYVASNLTRTSSHSQSEEGITTIKFVPIPQVLTMINKGTLCDAQSIAAIFSVLNHIQYVK